MDTRYHRSVFFFYFVLYCNILLFPIFSYAPISKKVRPPLTFSTTSTTVVRGRVHAWDHILNSFEF